MSWITQMFGSELESKCGKIKSEDLELGEGDVLGLYFSAHWCPPCRHFTPKLAEFYRKFNAKGGRKFQVVFVSADHSETQFGEYYKDMPWHALPFESEDINGDLSSKCSVTGIPKLVLFDSNGTQLKMKSDARTMVSTDPEGEDFPWAV